MAIHHVRGLSASAEEVLGEVYRSDVCCCSRSCRCSLGCVESGIAASRFGAAIANCQRAVA